MGSGPSIPVVRFEVLTGGQEASWEHQAAQVIWGGQTAAMFPGSTEAAASDAEAGAPATGAPVDIGLFSGGGKSMQVRNAPLFCLGSTLPLLPRSVGGCGD